MKKQVVIITDTTVKKLYSDYFPEAEIIIVKKGEKHKTLQTVQEIYAKLLNIKADRETFILGIGGGIVCDITGFVASTFMRGLNFAFVPTTLLAQVDASIGGKNGVNFNDYKNMIGVIRQPEFIHYDCGFLKTLPKKELNCGFAELIKHAIIADKKLFELLQKEYKQIQELEKSIIEKIIKRSIKIKLNIVKKDENDFNIRRILNLGHTLGHAIEAVSKGKVSHGNAVAVGICFSARLSKSIGLLKEKDMDEIIDLFKLYGLPTRLSSLGLKPEALVSAIMKDKKKAKNEIDFVLIKRIGSVKTLKLSINKIKEALKNDLS